LAIAALSACNLHNEGVDAPKGALSYPQALALSREDEDAGKEAGNLGAGPDFLYVANTNYDLRYNGASVQSYNLGKLKEQLDLNRCLTLGAHALSDASIVLPDHTIYADRVDAGVDAGVDDAGVALPSLGGMDGGVLLPAMPAQYETPRGVLCDGHDPIGDGRTPDYYEPLLPGMPPNPDCCFGEPSKVLALQERHVPIDSYASGIAVAPDNKRLYVPVESKSRLLYFDFITPGVPDCGLPEGERCRRGPGLKSPDDVPNENVPGQIANLVVGHMSELGAIKTPGEDPVFIATIHELGGFGLFVETDGAPLLEDAITGMPVRPTSLTFDRPKKLLYVTANAQPYFSRIGVRITPSGSWDGKESGPRELLFDSSPVTLSGVSQPADLRDIVIDPGVPNRLWVLIRGTQQSVAIVDLDPAAPGNARLVDELKLGAGASKLARIDQDGRSFVLASCYDSKSIFVFDAESHKRVAVVGNLSGPFQMVHDSVRRLVYVTDFRVSVVRVIDVEGLTNPAKPLPRIVATLGDPEFEGALP
jgi:DNA-binding beta-propeller fold protein YncE